MKALFDPTILRKQLLFCFSTCYSIFQNNQCTKITLIQLILSSVYRKKEIKAHLLELMGNNDVRSNMNNFPSMGEGKRVFASFSYVGKKSKNIDLSACFCLENKKSHVLPIFPYIHDIVHRMRE